MKKILEKITELRHALHARPELSMCEKETQEILIAFLKANTSFEITRRDGWFYAVKRGRTDGSPAGAVSDCGSGSPAGAVAFRADMDALPIDESESCADLPYRSRNPGVSHKCGHDGHMAALCGFALLLEEAERAAGGPGTGAPDCGGRTASRDVYLIFQPGEETGAGGEICAQLLPEQNISEIYAFHNLSGYPEGAVVYREGLTQPASEGIRITFAGKTSHASAPEEGKNPAAALARTALIAEGSCTADPMRLVTVCGMNAGGSNFGVSPGEGELCLTIRAEREADMDQMERGILAFAQNEAEKGGFGLHSEIVDRFPETRNHPDCLKKVIAAAGQLGLPAVPMETLWRASEDFGHYLKACPGAMFYVGNGEEYPALHTAEYDFNDRILMRAAEMLFAISQMP